MCLRPCYSLPAYLYDLHGVGDVLEAIPNVDVEVHMHGGGATAGGGGGGGGGGA